VIPYTCSDEWVEPRIMYARDCLMQDAPPPPSTECAFCSFVAGRSSSTAQ